MLSELKEFRTWVEIAVLAVAFFFILNFVRNTRGAGILKGLVFLFIVAFLGLMFLAEQARLENIQRMLSYILSGSAIALIVLFAPELRRGLSHLAQSRILSPLLRSQSSGIIDELANAAVKLSKNRIGALVAIERDVGLGEYVEHGCRIDATLTSELLETIFYPGSALHDGAVIVQHDRVAAAGCLLPLTDDTSLSKSMGTRHRAAIGISEETDAIALVVSEETGRISIAVNGKLSMDLSREALQKTLAELYSRNERGSLAFRKTRRGAEPGSPPSADLGPVLPNGPVVPSPGGNGSTKPLPGSPAAEAAAASEKKSDSKKREKKSAESALGGEQSV